MEDDGESAWNGSSWQPYRAITTATYDGFGRLTKVIRPGDDTSNPTIAITYYDTASPFWVKARQRISGTTYYEIRKFYNGLGQLIQVQTANATLDVGTRDIVVDYWYDPYGQVKEQSVPYAVTTGTTYRTPDLTQASTQTTYDVLGRPKLVTATDGATTVYVYADLQVTVTDANGNATTTLSDLWGRTIEVHPPLGPWTRYTYDAADHLIQVEQMSGASPLAGFTTTLAYDKAGRKLSMDDPDMGLWNYTYDALGNLLSQTDARGCTTDLAYDALNRLTGKTYNGVTCNATAAVSYTYDAYDGLTQFGRGRRTGMSDASGSTAWLYDQRGRVTQETKTISGSGTFVSEWSYKSNDALAWIRYPGGNNSQGGEYVLYSYHPQGALNKVEGSETYVQSLTYDAAGRIDVRTLGSDVLRTDYTYFGWTTANGQGRLKRLTVGTPTNPTSLMDLRYYSGTDTPKYDAVGNLLNIYDYKMGSPQTQTFTYDALNRLTSAQASGGTNGNYDPETYTYDTAGRLNSKSGVGTYAYSTSHKHAVTQAGSNTYGGASPERRRRDANGNMTQRIIGDVLYTLTYDAENRLTKVEQQDDPLIGEITIAEFKYDGDGNPSISLRAGRVQSTMNEVITAFVGNYYEVSGSTVKKYYYAGSQRIAMRDCTGGTCSAPAYLFGDHLSSTSLSYNAATAATVRTLYHPLRQAQGGAWGTVHWTSGSLPTKYTFTGQYPHTDDFGLLFYNARWGACTEREVNHIATPGFRCPRDPAACQMPLYQRLSYTEDSHDMQLHIPL